jgi:hypothetical protein
MRKYILLFFSVLLFAWACKYSSTPEGILKPGDMIKVLVEVHIVDASITNIDAPNNDSLYKYGSGRYLQMFKRMHTDSTQFKNSVKYYSARPAELEDMYTKVVAILQSKTDSLNKPSKPTKPANPNALPKK